MHRVQYRVVETIDPILDLLYDNPGKLLGRSYAGYLVFLFGGADEDFATWFARNIVALDSLTGADIGGAIFASRIKLRVPSCVTGNSDTDLSSFQRISEPLVDSMGRSRWRGQESEMTAVTYATDEIARRLGVLPHLPCLVVIDAVPSDEIEVMRLTEYATRDLIPLVREVVHRFRASPEFQPFFASLSRVQKLSEKRHDLGTAIAEQQRGLQQARRHVEYSLAQVPADARRALVDANVRRFQAALVRFPTASQKEAQNRTTRAESLQQQLYRYNKTIWSLNRFRALPWPLHDNDREAYTKVYMTHVRALLASRNGQPDLADPAQCQQIIAELAAAQAQLIDHLLDGLPLRSDMQAIVDQQNVRHCGAIEEKLVELTEVCAQVDSEIQAELHRLIACQCPSLKATFRAMARSRKIDTVRKKAGEGVLSFSAGLLKPDTLMKLWQLLSHH